MADFGERIQDEKYQELLGSLIDEFYAKVRGVKLPDVVKSQANLDMLETLVRYAGDHFDPKESMILLFVLGVYLANRDEAILPTNVN